MTQITTVGTEGSPATRSEKREAFAVDPWGTAYWLVSADEKTERRELVVYSFGPNRRRDGEAGVGGGDDILARAEIVTSRE